MIGSLEGRGGEGRGGEGEAVPPVIYRHVELIIGVWFGRPSAPQVTSASYNLCSSGASSGAHLA